MLWRFIQKNAHEGETEEAFLHLTGLNRRELKLLVDIRFLLSREVRELLNNIGPKIITRLSKESINELTTDRRGVRGRIDWQRTFSARATRGNDICIYTFSRRAQIFDLPENRLFLYLMRQVFEKARNFTKDDYLNITWYAETSHNQKWINNVSVIAAKAARILKNPYILKIGSLYEITNKIIELTKKNRQPHYKDLAVVAERYLFCQNHPVSYLNEELKESILEPLNKDTLYEIAVLFKTLQVALNCGWKEKNVSLIGSRSKYISIMDKDGVKLKLYYQKLPYLMAQNSKYGDIMSEYELSERLRRPDIILELYNGQKREIIIIEVKRSLQKGYLVDGTYKLLGYLKDFSEVNSEVTKVTGFLVGWSGIQSLQYSNDKEVHLFNWQNYDEGISTMLASKLESGSFLQELVM